MNYEEIYNIYILYLINRVNKNEFTITFIYSKKYLFFEKCKKKKVSENSRKNQFKISSNCN